MTRFLDVTVLRTQLFHTVNVSMEIMEILGPQTKRNIRCPKSRFAEIILMVHGRTPLFTMKMQIEEIH
jgi:hypothetical protein